MSPRRNTATERWQRTRRHCLAPVRRWTPARKAEICMALNGGIIGVYDLVRAHGLSPDEIAQWREAFQRSGFEGLKLNRAPRSAA